MAIYESDECARLPEEGLGGWILAFSIGCALLWVWCGCYGQYI